MCCSSRLAQRDITPPSANARGAELCLIRVNRLGRLTLRRCRPFALAAADVAAGLGTDPTRGLSAGEAADRLAQLGPNAITSEKPPSLWLIALGQFRNPMNIMLVAVSIVSFAIDETSTGIIVALLILLNVVLGSRQELKARESVTALSNLQVPHAKGHARRNAGFDPRCRRRAG